MGSIQDVKHNISASYCRVGSHSGGWPGPTSSQFSVDLIDGQYKKSTLVVGAMVEASGTMISLEMFYYWHQCHLASSSVLIVITTSRQCSMLVFFVMRVHNSRTSCRTCSWTVGTIQAGLCQQVADTLPGGRINMLLCLLFLLVFQHGHLPLCKATLKMCKFKSCFLSCRSKYAGLLQPPPYSLFCLEYNHNGFCGRSPKVLGQELHSCDCG